jgi:hypothetical protein
VRLESFAAWGLTALVTAFVGSYLGAYLKKKGENLATHEDIDKLLDQVSAVTQTTKETERVRPMSGIGRKDGNQEKMHSLKGKGSLEAW